MGLGNIVALPVKPVDEPIASHGKMEELSNGKDTTTGHWEFMGIVLENPFPTYPNGFPQEVLSQFEEAIGAKALGNKPASGTAIIDELGPEHMETGNPIVYTSADSVFQIAAHEDIIPIEKLYEWCEIARKQLQGDHAVSRVIARPFVGKPGEFTRTPRRHDYSLNPVEETVLDRLLKKGVPTYGIGKIKDIYTGAGIEHSVSTVSNADGMVKIDEHLENVKEGLVFANLVDFDMQYGHRNNPEGYADALKEFDIWLGEFLPKLSETDLLLITADHGCDPTYPGTDHTREHVPVIAYRKGSKGRDLGIRKSFSDIGATIARVFDVAQPAKGSDFLESLGE
jgi:phosphopentomutase